MKAKYGVKMFTSLAMSSLVLKRYDGDFENYDLTSEDHVHIHVWINKRSVKSVDELTNEGYNIYGLLRQPMFLVFVDFEDKRYANKSYNAVEVIKEIAPKYMHLMGFFYVNNSYFQQRKRVLGVTWDELPSMAFNMVDNRVVPYPRGAKITKDALFDWFDDILTGKIQVKTSGFSKEVKDFEIFPMLLNNTV
jgi:hypothetical protein